MDFADISGGTHLARFGIPEPEASLPAAEPAEGDIIVVPALCCAPDGRRQGQGGGYYDRFLARYPGVTSACLARERLLDEGVFRRSVAVRRRPDGTREYEVKAAGAP